MVNNARGTVKKVLDSNRKDEWRGNRPRTAALILGLLFVIYAAAASGRELGHDFIDEAMWTCRVIVCGDDEQLKAVELNLHKGHCDSLEKSAASYKKSFVDKVQPFLKNELPKNLPASVVYPFGGSDLFAALATFPFADDVTTISLEHSGDPRRLPKAGKHDLDAAMLEARNVLAAFYAAHDNTNANVHLSDRGKIPGQLVISLAAAKVFGYKPISLKFFHIDESGNLVYYSLKKIAELERVKQKRLNRAWDDPNISVAFCNMEIIYEKTVNHDGPQKFVHRHIAADLSNKIFNGSPLEKFLNKKGRISAMTKAASYLMWRDDFSGIRNYLLKNMMIMVSDSTGILPGHAQKAGFEIKAFGNFNGAFLDDRGGAGTIEWKKLIASQPHRELPFRYGYSDIRGAKHMFIYYIQKK
jgi:hypothetical protein